MCCSGKEEAKKDDILLGSSCPPMCLFIKVTVPVSHFSKFTQVCEFDSLPACAQKQVDPPPCRLPESLGPYLSLCFAFSSLAFSKCNIIFNRHSPFIRAHPLEIEAVEILLDHSSFLSSHFSSHWPLKWPIFFISPALFKFKCSSVKRLSIYSLEIYALHKYFLMKRLNQ